MYSFALKFLPYFCKNKHCIKALKWLFFDLVVNLTHKKVKKNKKTIDKLAAVRYNSSVQQEHI